MDMSVIGKATWLPFVVWLVAVVVVAFGGRQPGVVCATPMAWLLALWVGLRCAAYTRSPQKSSRLTEAALAGGIVGLLQGLLFFAITTFVMGDIKPDERQKAVILDVVMIVLGSVVSALLSVAIAASQERR